MKISTALLLTHDPDFEKTFREALAGTETTIISVHEVTEALETGCCRGTELDLAVIDRSDCHAITLLHALRECFHQLPVIVVASTRSCHCAALAYANGAAGCIAKPISVPDLKLLLNQFRQPKLQLTAA
ncbi:MAG TPA: hypothetical protein VFJ55_05800 [Chthoniobacterales bacterium]|nr:hypothetical protein [Chthoniobacterales bacterium]